MSKDPAALFYIDTWLSSTAEMDADTRGWYLNLILHQYDKGDLPNDIERLAQLAMVKFSEYERWQQVWQQVLQHKFQQNDNGRLENSKVNEMLQKREVFKNKRSMAGKISRVAKVANKMKSLHCGVDEIKEYLKNNPDHEIFEHLDNQQVLQQMLKQVSQQVLQLFRNEDGNENVIRDIVNYYHEKCTNLPKVKSLTDQRKSQINARLNENGVDKVKEAIDIASKNSFLNGDNQKGWRADLEFITRATKFAKILEGGFSNQKQKKVGAQLKTIDQ